MNGKTFTLAALAATLMIGTSATASFARDGQREGQMGRGGPERMFVTMLQQMDTNSDGKISKEEAAAGRDKLFTTIDTDNDGTLTPGEMRKHREAMMEARKAEMAQNAPQADDAPAPGDDDRPGWRHHHGDRADAGEGPHGKGPHGWRHDARNDEGERRPGPRGGMGMMRVADTDENGQLSKAEAVAMGDKMFERMDKDKDGSITAADFPKRGAWLR